MKPIHGKVSSFPPHLTCCVKTPQQVSRQKLEPKNRTYKLKSVLLSATHHPLQQTPRQGEQADYRNWVEVKLERLIDMREGILRVLDGRLLRLRRLFVTVIGF